MTFPEQRNVQFAPSELANLVTHRRSSVPLYDINNNILHEPRLMFVLRLFYTYSYVPVINYCKVRRNQ